LNRSIFPATPAPRPGLPNNQDSVILSLPKGNEDNKGRNLKNPLRKAPYPFVKLFLASQEIANWLSKIDETINLSGILETRAHLIFLAADQAFAQNFLRFENP
jgi:hypothetical protein